MNILRTIGIWAIALLATAVALAENNGGMMNGGGGTHGGGWGSDSMGAYGGYWFVLLIVAVLVGLDVWVVKQKAK